jgi:hypothetical protein
MVSIGLASAEPVASIGHAMELGEGMVGSYRGQQQ